MARRITGTLVAALAAIALAGCDMVPETAAPAEAGLAPGVEALAYLPARAEVVAVVDTEIGGRRWRAARRTIRRAGFDRELARVIKRLAVAGLDVEGGRDVLGNLMAWAPRERLAALVATDRARLEELVAVRVRTGILSDAGSHRDARLLEGDGLALAVRGASVVAAPTLRIVRRALDRREKGNGYDVNRFKRAVAGLPVDSLARAAVDVRALVRRHARGWGPVPFVDALDTAGFALRAGNRGGVIDARVDFSDRVLRDDDPLRKGRAAMPRVFGGLHLSFSDLPRLLSMAYRGAFAVDPKRTAAAELAGIIVRDRGRERIDPFRDLLAAMEGPATLALDSDGAILRAQLRRSESDAAADAVGRISARLPAILAAAGIDGVVMRPLAGLKAAIRGSDVLAVFGVLGDVVVLGEGRPETLIARATNDAADEDDKLPGALALHAGPLGLEELLGIEHGRELRGWVARDRRGLRARVTVSLR